MEEVQRIKKFLDHRSFEINSAAGKGRSRQTQSNRRHGIELNEFTHTRSCSEYMCTGRLYSLNTLEVVADARYMLNCTSGGFLDRWDDAMTTQRMGRSMTTQRTMTETTAHMGRGFLHLPFLRQAQPAPVGRVVSMGQFVRRRHSF